MICLLLYNLFYLYIYTPIYSKLKSMNTIKISFHITCKDVDNRRLFEKNSSTPYPNLKKEEIDRGGETELYISYTPSLLVNLSISTLHVGVGHIVWGRTMLILVSLCDYCYCFRIYVFASIIIFFAFSLSLNPHNSQQIGIRTLNLVVDLYSWYNFDKKCIQRNSMVKNV